MKNLRAVRNILKWDFQINIAFANCIEFLVHSWLPHFPVVLECRRKSWVVICANFSLFHSIDVSVLFDKLFEKLVVGWVVSSDFVVENHRRVEIAWILEPIVALYEELTLELSLE